MSARSPRVWLRPSVAPDGDLVWDVLEASARPTRESLGPWDDAAAAVAAAEPDRVRLPADLALLAV